jgi:hypothetical protein
LFGALICRQHPPMSAVVLDLPEAVDQSGRLAQEEGIDDVVTHRAGDALVDDLGRGYDVAFLGNFLHHSPEQIQGVAPASSERGQLAPFQLPVTARAPR